MEVSVRVCLQLPVIPGPAIGWSPSPWGSEAPEQESENLGTAALCSSPAQPRPNIREMNFTLKHDVCSQRC